LFLIFIFSPFLKGRNVIELTTDQPNGYAGVANYPHNKIVLNEGNPEAQPQILQSRGTADGTTFPKFKTLEKLKLAPLKLSNIQTFQPKPTLPCY